jgi:DnaJ-class molecular chaperone
VTIVLTCRRCKGTGVVPNPKYEVCRSLKTKELQRYFRMSTSDEPEETEDLIRSECGEPIECPCPVCEGDGVLEFDEAEWDFTLTGTNEEE